MSSKKNTKSSPATKETLPDITLVCHGCQKLLIDTPCACPLATKLDYYEGIPRTLFGQSFWGEMSSKEMAELLKACETTHWQKALDAVLPNSKIDKHLKTVIGPDIVYALPWDEIHDVLDIGAGMGFMTALLAKYAKKVIAVEAVPERAHFINLRAKQDNLPIYPVIASAIELPFQEAQFDLITLNGVFEYIGLWSKEDPEIAQEKFLQQALKLLKPGGVLYIGIETRYGLGSLLGARDHSGLRYTSVMPRKMADWYCKIKSVPFYGSEENTSSYRTYTHTPCKYSKMFQNAGLDDVQVFGVFDGYNRQIGIYELNKPAVRREIRARVFPAVSIMGKIRQLVTSAPIIGEVIENEVLILGRKGKKLGSAFWPGLNNKGYTAQINSATKYYAVNFESNMPTTITEFAKFPFTEKSNQNAFQMSSQIQALFQDEVHHWKMRWPKPIEQGKYQGRTFYRYEYLRGKPAQACIINAYTPLNTQLKMIDDIVDAYVEMCSKLTSKLQNMKPGTHELPWNDPLDVLEKNSLPKDFEARIQQARDYITNNTSTPSVMHGDLHFSNIIIADNSKFLIFDWENVSLNGLIAVDLVRLCYNTILDSRKLPEKRAKAIVAQTYAALKRVGPSLGVRAEDWQNIETLYIGQQEMLQQSRKASMDKFLAIYKNREFIDNIYP